MKTWVTSKLFFHGLKNVSLLDMYLVSNVFFWLIFMTTNTAITCFTTFGFVLDICTNTALIFYWVFSAYHNSKRHLFFFSAPKDVTSTQDWFSTIKLKTLFWLNYIKCLHVKTWIFFFSSSFTYYFFSFKTMFKRLHFFFLNTNPAQFTAYIFWKPLFKRHSYFGFFKSAKKTNRS